MVLLLLNLSLVLAGAATASIAVLGETRKKGRLTTVGWITVVGCIVTFCLGVGKELVSKRDADDAWARSQKLELVAENRADKSEKELQQVRMQLTISDKKIDNLKMLLEADRVKPENVAASSNSAPNGVFEGEVRDSRGLVAGIRVIAISNEGVRLGETTSNQDGRFHLVIDNGQNQTINLVFERQGLNVNPRIIQGLASQGGQFLKVIVGP